MTTAELIAARRSEPWREELRKSKKNKERTDIPRVEMNELDAEYRSHTRLEGGTTLPRLPESDLYGRLSGKYQYPDIHQEYRTG